MADYAYQQTAVKNGARYQPKGKEAGMQARTARARITGVNASWKDLCNVCRNVRGWDSDDALEFLDQASRKEKAILFTRHNTGKGHRRQLGGKKGGFPVKSVKIVLEVLKNAVANANRLGLSHVKVAHIMANKENTFPRMSPKGRRIRHDYETAFVEIVLEEVQETADSKKADVKKGAKPEAKKAEAKKVDAPKSETETKKQEMSSTDRHRPIENRKLAPAHKEEQRI
ncbi:50S ribosomal protein L22 [uncultured archaeon]|nr:50S ribosomal protein L22 [uncultured archaeon]